MNWIKEVHKIIISSMDFVIKDNEHIFTSKTIPYEHKYKVSFFYIMQFFSKASKMEYISPENLLGGGEDGGDDASSGWCTATPQRQRRPLQQLNFPNTASPKPNVSVTPYK